jgi:hypothetical protein
MRTIAVTMLALLLGAAAAPAQVEWNGTLDLSYGLGGENSRFALNHVTREHRRAHMAIRQINLALFAPLEEEFSVEARLTADDWEPGDPGAPELRLGVVNYNPLGRRWTLSAGRFVTPFGRFPAKQYLFERSFAVPPALYGGLLVNLSDARGFWPEAGEEGDWGEEDVGVGIVSPYTLATGFVLDWWADAERGRELQVAVANSAPSSHRAWTDVFSPALVVRHGWNGEQLAGGVSAAFGGWMVQEDFAVHLREPASYRQILAGVDGAAALGPLSLEAEAAWARWNAPRWVSASGAVGSGQFAADPLTPNEPYEVTPSLVAGYFTARVDIPVRATSFYLAGRIETVQFLTMEDPVTLNSTGESAIEWDRNLLRWSFAAGTPLGEHLHAKASWTDQVRSGEPTPRDDWSLALTLSAAF